MKSHCKLFGKFDFFKKPTSKISPKTYSSITDPLNMIMENVWINDKKTERMLESLWWRTKATLYLLVQFFHWSNLNLQDHLEPPSLLRSLLRSRSKKRSCTTKEYFIPLHFIITYFYFLSCAIVHLLPMSYHVVQ